VVTQQAGATYAFALADAGTVVESTYATGATFTIPLNSSVRFGVPTEITALDGPGSGVLTVTGAAGVTLNGVSGGSVATTGAYQAITLIQTAANTWVGTTGSAGGLSNPVTAARISRPTVMLGVCGSSSPALADFTSFNALIAPRSVDMLLFMQALNSEPIFYSAYPTWAAALQAIIMSACDPTGALNQFTAGTYDTSGLYSGTGLVGLATACAAYGGPVVIRLAHEFNGNWSSFGYGTETAAQFVAGWKHIVNLFRAYGATNVLWCWNPNVWSGTGWISANQVDPTVADGSGVNWYPGDAYVDIIALDGYMDTVQSPLLTPPALFLNNYLSLCALAPSKPFAIAEFGCTSSALNSAVTGASANGGLTTGKAAWYDLLFQMVQTQMPNCIFVTQWQRSQSDGDYTISSSSADAPAAAAFVRSVNAFPFTGSPGSGPNSATTPTLAGVGTFTNKRITSRVLSLSAASATPAINTDLYDVVHITAQGSTAITSFTTNLTGTPVDGDTLRISVTGSGAVGLTFGTSFEASGNVALPTTTVAAARLDMGFDWNSETSKWRCVGVA
jgi:hypothetical protein